MIFYFKLYLFILLALMPRVGAAKLIKKSASPVSFDEEAD